MTYKKTSFAELSDDIQSQIEAKETELGRPLTLGEQSNVLKTYDSPIVAASRYNQHQYLIGPALFPYYVTTLKMAVFAVLALWIAGAAIRELSMTGSRAETIVAAWPSLWSALLWIVAIVTLIFAARERVPGRSSKCWDPRKLGLVRDSEPVSRSQLVFEMFLYLLFLCWLVGIPGVRSAVWYTITGLPTAVPFTGGQVWQQIVAGLVFVSLATIAVDCVNLIRPEGTRLRAAMLVATNVFMVIVLSFALKMHGFIVPAPHAANAAQAQQAAAALNTVVYYALIAWAIIAGLVALYNVRLLLRSLAVLRVRRDVALDGGAHSRRE